MSGLRVVAESGRSGRDDDGTDDRLPPRELLFVEQLASGASLADAAKGIGLSARSARRWKTKPHIAEAVRARVAENVSVGRAILAAGMSKAATALVGMASGVADAESARVAACKAVVDSATRALEAEEIEARLAELEQLVAKKGSR